MYVEHTRVEIKRYVSNFSNVRKNENTRLSVDSKVFVIVRDNFMDFDEIKADFQRGIRLTFHKNILTFDNTQHSRY